MGGRRARLTEPPFRLILLHGFFWHNGIGLDVQAGRPISACGHSRRRLRLGDVSFGPHSYIQFGLRLGWCGLRLSRRVLHLENSTPEVQTSSASLQEMKLPVLASVAAALLLLPGCALVPRQVEFFQKKVKSVPVLSNSAVNRQRQAAGFIATHEDTNRLASSLSASLGAPLKPW